MDTSRETTDGPPAAAEPARSSTTVRDAARDIAAVATLGAAVIHFAFAPAHFDDTTSHGAFFVVVGWAQLFGAAALAFRWRPQRRWLLGTAALNLAVAALWLLTRTAGLPAEPAEPVGFPDALASALEVVAATAAVAVALGWLVDRTVQRPSLAVTGLPTIAVVAVVTASVVPSLGGGHSHDGDGHDHGPGVPEGESAADGHDHGTNGGDDDDFAARRIAALTGYLSDEEIERHRESSKEFLAEQLRARSGLLAELPEDERERRIAEFVDWSVEHALDAEAPPGLEEGEATMHVHGLTEWKDLTSPEEVLQLQEQLRIAGSVVPKYPTAADAMADGYFMVTPYVPGIGAHYLNVELLTRDGFDPAAPEMLLFNGNEPTSELVGLSYATLGDEPPEGFAGENDEWHEHPALCIVGGLVVGPDNTPEDLCESVGGRIGMPWEKPMWMGHLWQVEGWESPWGLFSGENPALNLATADL
ncbi:MAG TPA: hypothetical protein VKZ72_11475 [Acidimicrobiales bacterium]|nr:hypothetical protein [Acidimicrobiales bacterium]